MDRRGILFRAIVLVAAVSGTRVSAADRTVDEFTVAAGHYQAGRWDLAAEGFASFRQLFPDHALAGDAAFYEAEARAQLGEFAEAAAALDRLISSGQAGKRLQRAMFRRGETAYLARDYENAEAHLQAFWTSYPDDDLLQYVLAYLGDVHAAAGEHARAEEAYRECLAKAPEGPLAVSCRSGLARALIARGKAAEAEEVLKSLAGAEDPGVAESSLLELARLAYRRGNYAAARQRSASLLEQSGDHDDAARLLLAEALSRLGEAESADEEFRRVCDSGAEARLRERALYGRIRLAADRHDQAEVARLAAEFLDSFEASRLAGIVQAAVGESQLAQRKFAAAREAFEAALASSAAERVDAACHAGLAVCSAAEGDLRGARSQLSRLGGLGVPQETLAATTYRVAELAYSGGFRNDAAALFQQVVGGGSPELAAKALAGLAWSRLKQEDLLGSADAFEQLIVRYPSDPRAAEAGLLRAQILERRGQYDAALATYRRVIDELARDDVLPRAIFFIARLHDRLRQFSEARAFYERLLEEFPEDERAAEARYHLGWMLRDAGESAAAVECWQAVHESGPAAAFWGEATYLLAEHAVEHGDLHRAGAFAHALIESLAEARAERRGAEDGGEGERLYARSRLLAAHLAMERDDWEAARGQLARIVAECPGDPLHACAQFWLAEAAYRLSDFDAAHDELRRLESVAAGRDDEWVPFVPLRLAQILAHRKEWSHALAAAQRVIDQHADFGLRHEADYVVGRCLAARGEFDAAREAYRRVIESESGGKTETAAMAQWMIGESYMHQQDYDAALRAYLRGEILFPYAAWQATSLLQAGKCYELLSEWNYAEATYRRLVERFPDATVVEEARARLVSVTRQAARD